MPQDPPRPKGSLCPNDVIQWLVQLGPAVSVGGGGAADCLAITEILRMMLLGHDVWRRV